MKSNYKQLGQYIRQVDVRNVDGKEENLLGVSVQKQFIPSIANTVGTDFSKYKVVKKGQFTYIPDTSRRGDKIGIALLEDYEEGLVSNVYTVFEVIDENQLMSEYLMLWFKRPEFDRYARFKSHGSVREVMDWDEMCKVELPVPPIEKQRSIVKAYQTITDRIALKRKVNENLVTIGIASIQKNIGRGVLINLTDAERERLILPEGFSIKTVSEFCKDTKSGSTPSRTNNEYWENGTIPWVKSGEVHNNITLQTDEHITPLGLSESSTKLLSRDTVLMAMYGVTAGEVGYTYPKTTFTRRYEYERITLHTCRGTTETDGTGHFGDHPGEGRLQAGSHLRLSDWHLHHQQGRCSELAGGHQCRNGQGRGCRIADDGL